MMKDNGFIAGKGKKQKWEGTTPKIIQMFLKTCRVIPTQNVPDSKSPTEAL